MNRLLLIVLVLEICQQVLGQSLSEAPLCAQKCLASATSAQDVCMGLDVKCLCQQPEYVGALSCCLATECSPADQQKGIEFNLAACGAVNETAPNFVGCSPDSDSAGSATGSLISTIDGAVEPALTSFIGDIPTVAPFNGKALLAGTCTQPYFAQVTDGFKDVIVFAKIGCSEKRDQCCPFDSDQNAVLSKCPQDYFTTAGACCPSGWQIYSTGIGGPTPCFTRPSTTYVPAETPSGPAVSVIQGNLFARKFDLSESALESSGSLGAGAIAGIAIGTIAILAILGVTLFIFLRRRRQARQGTSESQAKGAHGATAQISGSEMAMSSPTSVTHELASPQTVPPSPGSPASVWLPASAAGAGAKAASPPAYEHGHGHGSPPDPKRKTQRGGAGIAQELPGSTFILEHHPVYSHPSRLEAPTPAISTTATDASSPAATIRTHQPSPPGVVVIGRGGEGGGSSGGGGGGGGRPTTPQTPTRPMTNSSISPGAVSPLTTTPRSQ